MTSKERVLAALNHKEPDRVPVDFGGHRGDRHPRQDRRRPARPLRPREAAGQGPRALPDARPDRGRSQAGPRPRRRRRLRRRDDVRLPQRGLEAVAPGRRHSRSSSRAAWRRPRTRTATRWSIPKGDRTAPPSGRMPKDGFFFDTIVRQDPIDEDKLDPEDNLEEFGPISDADLDYFDRAVREAAGHGPGGHRHLRRAGLRRHRPRAGAVPEASARASATSRSGTSRR